MKILTQLFCLTIFTLSIGIGVSLVYLGVSRTVLVYRSQHWTEVSGRVISSKVGCVTYSKGTVSCFPDITYFYEVEGKNYSGDVVSYGFTDGSGKEYADERGYAEEKVSQYPIGSNVKVFYNPYSPDESCLEVGGSALGFLLPIVTGSIFTVFFIWILFRDENSNRRRYISKHSFWR